MKTLILIVDTGLSILVPLLLIKLLLKANKSIGNKQNSTMLSLIIIGIGIWVSLIWIAGYAGIFEYNEGETLPKFLWALFTPVLVAVSLLFNKLTRGLIDQISLQQLIGFQFWRIFGSIFFIVAFVQIGPSDLIISGFGDFLTGVLAITTYFLLRKQNKFGGVMAWIFNLVGIVDLLIILFIFLANYPIWSDALPSSEIAGQFPLILVVGIVAPVALFFHVLTVRSLIFLKNTKMRNLVMEKMTKKSKRPGWKNLYPAQ